MLSPVLGTTCSNLLDDDGDGLIDFPVDPGCAAATDTDERGPGLPCDDGVDNDGDSLVDFRADGLGDPGCGTVAWPLEDPQCQDGIDNDKLFGIDFDGGVSIHGACAFGTCPPGVSDPDGDGVADPDPQCVSFADNREATSGGRFHCALGPELAILLPLLLAWRSRRLTRRPAA